MAYNYFGLNKIKEQYDHMLQTKLFYKGSLDSNSKNFQEYIKNKFENLIAQGKKEYELDLNLAMEIYIYLNNDSSFNEVLESSYDFWRHVAVYLIPDIVARRHSIESVEYYYKKGLRVYPYALYWYIHLSWQGDKEKTLDILRDNTTDEIMNLVERPSRIGINLELYRQIMKKYSRIPKNNRTINLNGKRVSIFRIIFTKNTSKLMVYRPEIYPGGIDGYVDMLFDEFKELIK